MSEPLRGAVHPGQRTRAAAFVALIMAAAACLAPTVRAAESPFSNLVGTWSGDAKATLDGGADGPKTEAMRCKAYYTGQGHDGLTVAIRCANASAKIDLRATLAYASGAVTGQWEERTYNASGSVTGKASANAFDLAISGGGLNAAMAVSITGASHHVRITTQGSGLKAVDITFTRG